MRLKQLIKKEKKDINDLKKEQKADEIGSKESILEKFVVTTPKEPKNQVIQAFEMN